MVRVHRRPTVAVLATGDELVSVDQAVGPGQIRNSNEAMLCAQIEGAGAIPVRLGIASDNREALREKIQWGLRCDMLVLSGGVSAGTLDLVPSELASAGVVEVFHKVELKPGKPVWFGMLKESITKWTLDDFLQQLQMIRRKGSLKNYLKMVPGLGSTIESPSQFDPDEDMRRIESILLAMTPDERKCPDNIHGDRLEQIAKECGAEVSDVTRLLTDFKNMALMMEKMAGMGMHDRTKALRKLSVKTQEGQAHHSALLPSRCCVFGLPGNPVSSLVCCELFVKTAIRRLMGQSPVLPQSIPAKLEHDHAARADRPTYHPARLTWSTEGPLVTLVPWHGSSDLCGTVAANAMVFLSGEARQYRAGDAVETIAW